MLGMIRVRQDEEAPRTRTDRVETLGGVSFQTTVLQIRNPVGVLDSLLIRQAVRRLFARGVTCVAAPEIASVTDMLARYGIARMTHEPLLCALAPQIMDYILRRTDDGAVLLYAHHVDHLVLRAARHAAQYYRNVVLDVGMRGEWLRRRLLDETGCAALLGQVSAVGSRTAVLLFDAPPAQFETRMPRPTSVALRIMAAPYADYNDVCISCPSYEPLIDTDREAVLGAVISHNQGSIRSIEIQNLVKK